MPTGGGTKYIWFGNDGSAADAQHLACDIKVRYKQTVVGGKL